MKLNHIISDIFDSIKHSTSEEIGRAKGHLKDFKINKKWVLGIFLMVLVVLTWVGCSFVTQYIFRGLKYGKPFFVSCFSSSLFSLYMLGFIIFPSWRAIPWRHRSDSKHIVELEGKTNNISDNSNEKNQTDNDDFQTGSGTSNEIEMPHDHSDSTSSKLCEDKNNCFKDNNDANIISMESTQQKDNNKQDFSDDKEKIREASIRDVIIISFQLSILWSIGNYTYNLALYSTSISNTSIISSTTPIFALILCHFLRVERFTLLKLLAIVVTFLGVLCITLVKNGTEKHAGKHDWMGDVSAIFSAAVFGIYITFIKLRVNSRHYVKIPMLFAFVGIFSMFLSFPLLSVAHFVGWEKFVLPNLDTTIYLTLKNIVSVVICEVVWCYVIYLSSTIAASLGMGLLVPFSIILEIAIGRKRFEIFYAIGAFLVLLGFVVINLII